MKIYEKLAKVQQKLKSPKSEYSSFGKYNYRTAEKILEELKPLLEKNKLLLTLTDSVEMVGERIYVAATAILVDIEDEDNTSIQITAYAREDLERPKYSESQLTGAASSYARKYALSGMFLLSEEKDSDEITAADDPDEELNKADPDPDPEPRERRRRRKKEKDPMEEDFMNIPDGVDETEGLPFGGTLEEDTYFYIEKDDNYVLKHAGDEEPIGAKKISKEEYEEGVNRIAKKTEEETPKRTRRRRKEREADVR